MKSKYSSLLRVAFLFFVGESLQLTNADAVPRLEDVIEAAERESKTLAKEINRWLLRESRSLLKGDEEVHLRSHRSIDKDDEEKQTDTNLLSEASQVIVRRDAENKDKKYHKKESGVPVNKSKIKKVNSNPVAKGHHQNARSRDSVHVIKKQGLDIQADKHHTKKVEGNKKAEKAKEKIDKLSKARLVKALIEGDSEPKKDTGIAERTYKELAEFIASSDQYSIETGSKKSGIPRPVSKVQGRQIKLTKKHRRVLDILSKLAPNVLRKYFHQKGLDKYWKVMEGIKKINAAKRNKKEKKVMDDIKNIKAGKQNNVEKLTEQDSKGGKIHTQEKQKLSSGIKHPVKDILLKKQTKLEEKSSNKEPSQYKTVNDKAIKKLHKQENLRNSSHEVIVVKPAKQKHAKKLKKEEAVVADHENKQSHKTTVEPHPKAVPQPQKDKKNSLFKAIKSHGVAFVEKENEKPIFEKNVHPSAEAGTHVKNTVANSAQVDLKYPGFKDVPKQEREKKVSEPVVVRKTAPAKKINGDAKDLMVSANQAKISTTKNEPKKLEEPNQVVVNKDSSTDQIKNLQQEKLTPQHQVKSVAKSTLNKTLKNLKDTAKTSSSMAHHLIKATHAPQLELKHNQSLDVKAEHPASGKINYLREKIRKTNNLKFKVAQALLAHCETQNRLRKVFDDVNSSLKKAAVLAKAIGKKFGIQQNDIDKITSEHTDGAVEQFLNKIF